MATDPTHPRTLDEPDRPGNVARPSGAGIPLADEGDVAFGAMAGVAVIAAVLISVLALGGFFRNDTASSADTEAAAEGATEEVEAEETTTTVAEEEDEAAAPAETTTTEAEETTTTTEAEETTTTEAAAEGAAAVVDAGQGAIELTGTVPDQATADGLVAAAIASGYTDDQITNSLEIVDGATPYTLTLTGSFSNALLAEQISTSFAATLDGAAGEVSVDDQIEITEASDLEADLNALVAASPILFETGTDVITADTIGVVDQAAELLLASPDAVVEVGGHTDSRGSDASNLALSDLRAARVVAELVDRGVSPDQLTAKGYGETLLAENPDDTTAQQQANRRIEFRVIG